MLKLALSNGEEDGDTNSSKAGIIRVGFGSKNFDLGFSLKAQDGIGSENQKEYKNHAGFDCCFRKNRLSISGEIIYDQYGFHRYIEEEKIYWPVSFYYRDIFYKTKTPIEGIGGYINLKYSGEKFIINLNYGEYHPQKIGNQYHDEVNKRFILKFLKRIKSFKVFLSVLFENEREHKEEWRSGEKGLAFLLGISYTWKIL